MYKVWRGGGGYLLLGLFLGNSQSLLLFPQLRQITTSTSITYSTTARGSNGFVRYVVVTNGCRVDLCVNWKLIRKTKKKQNHWQCDVLPAVGLGAPLPLNCMEEPSPTVK